MSNNKLYIKQELEQKIRKYCEINNISQVNDFANRCAQKGFNILLYGMSPSDNINRENNGIKQFDKNERIKEQISKREDKGEQEQKEQYREKRSIKEESEPIKEGEKVIRRSIKIIKKD